MSVPLNVANTWPATLPLPSLEYSGAAFVPTIISPNSAGRSRRRSRWTTTYANVDVNWKFSKDQYAAFLVFWGTTLGNGSATFSIELRYPKSTDLDVWVVQFVGGLNNQTEDESIKLVQATLQIHTLAAIADAATYADPSFFFVLGEASSGAPAEQFAVTDGNLAVQP